MLFEKVEVLLQRCRELGIKLRTAESCTAGGVAVALASVSGASDVLDRAWVTYSNQAKMDELAVPQALLDAYGAVSEPVVRAMAEAGVSLACSSDSKLMCVAISGIAGPAGGTEEKPVGTVWMAVGLSSDKSVQSKKFQFEGKRDAIQAQAIEAAIDFLAQAIK